MVATAWTDPEFAARPRAGAAAGVADAAEVDDLTPAWQDAAARTPHGRPIVLGS